MGTVGFVDIPNVYKGHIVIMQIKYFLRADLSNILDDDMMYYYIGLFVFTTFVFIFCFYVFVLYQGLY